MKKEYIIIDEFGNCWGSGYETLKEAEQAQGELYAWFIEMEEEPPALEINVKIMSLT